MNSWWRSVVRRLSNCWTLRLLFAGVLMLASAGGSLRADAPNTKDVLGRLRADLKNKDSLPFEIRSKADQLSRYYDQPTARLVWLEQAKGDELINAITEVSKAGLTNIGASVGRLKNMSQMRRSSDPSLLSLVELTYSATYLLAVESLYLGRTDLYKAKLHRRTLERFIYPDLVLDLAANQPISDVLVRVQPKHPDYVAIRVTLAAYVALEKQGGWPSLTAGPDLKQGDSGPRVSDLRARLAISGELGPSDGIAVFDADLVNAVKQFQRSHNLPSSGIADRRTVLALNVPIRDRIAQLTANLERWRWFEDLPEGKVAVINVNRGRLELQQADKLKLFSIKSSSACEQHAAFNSTIDHVILNPSFAFPQELSTRYVLPALQKNPEKLDPSVIVYAATEVAGKVDWKGYSESNFPFTVRQIPGRSNFLGLFQLPVKDDDDVSIHGRPLEAAQLPVPRELLPACVAVTGSSEEVLAELGAQQVNKTDPVGSTEGPRVNLNRPMPVIFLYATVWRDESGGLVFGPDPLGMDATLARELLESQGS